MLISSIKGEKVQFVSLFWEIRTFLEEPQKRKLDFLSQDIAKVWKTEFRSDERNKATWFYFYKFSNFLLTNVELNYSFYLWRKWLKHFKCMFSNIERKSLNLSLVWEICIQCKEDKSDWKVEIVWNTEHFFSIAQLV